MDFSCFGVVDATGDCLLRRLGDGFMKFWVCCFGGGGWHRS